MAARGANISLACELMQLIDEEEYVQIIPSFKDDDYLNKNEVCSLKKMTSGKLWVDNRKFVTRQNTPITSGMFELIGASINRSASDTKVEACDFLLDPDNKDVRSIIRDSLTGRELPYSKWITKLSDVHPPCDAAVLYLLCRTFKRHAVVLTSSKIWSTFKAGNRNPLDMFVKADFVLLWLGDNRFAEVKPLKTVTSTLGPLVEWQQLTDSIHVVHEKRRTEKKTRKPRQPRPSMPISKPDSPAVSTPQKGCKRQSKVQIDYKNMHKEGLTARSPKQQKILPKASGPSESRIESQRMITRELLQKQTKDKGYNTTAKIVGTCIKVEKKDDKKTIKTETKQESETKVNTGNRIKIEASEVHMVHRKNPADSVKNWNYIHPSGSPCGRKHRLRGNLRSDELPDLIPPTTTKSACSTSITPGVLPVSTPHYTDKSSGVTETGTTAQPSKSNDLSVSTPHASVHHVDQAETKRNTHTPISVSTQRTSTQKDTYTDMATSTTTNANDDSVQIPVSTTQAISMDIISEGSMASNAQSYVSTPTAPAAATTPIHREPPNITRVQNEPTVNVTHEADIQTAQTLLELHETLDLPDNNLMADFDNSEIMPVNAAPVPDYCKDYPLPAPSNNNDTDDTIEYADVEAQMDTLNPNPDSHIAGEQSPPGRFRFRHHGI